MVRSMTYVITSACVDVMDQSCIEVCPVDCISVEEGDRMCYIEPDICTDCGVCEPECPVEAIQPDTEAEAQKFLELNTKYSEEWPNITRKGKVPADADDWRDVSEKFENHFSSNPGAGG